MIVLSYGGGRQTVAICCLIARGILPRPDRIVMADTGRENVSTWNYLEKNVQPMLDGIGSKVEIAPRSLATVDLYGHNGDILIPVYTATGKLPSFCSNEWKRRVVDRYLRDQGITGGERWIGFALEERRRVTRMLASESSSWTTRFPLVDLMMTTEVAAHVVAAQGLPPAPVSACWMCPNKRNSEWNTLTPEEFEQACCMDEEIRNEDIANGGTGIWLHHSRTPLRVANLTVNETSNVVNQCSLGMCFV